MEQIEEDANSEKDQIKSKNDLALKNVSSSSCCTWPIWSSSLAPSSASARGFFLKQLKYTNKMTKTKSKRRAPNAATTICHHMNACRI